MKAAIQLTLLAMVPPRERASEGRLKGTRESRDRRCCYAGPPWALTLPLNSQDISRWALQRRTYVGSLAWQLKVQLTLSNQYPNQRVH
jgi:hypothetical protein